MPRVLVIAALIGLSACDHSATVESNGVEYEILATFSDFQGWTSTPQGGLLATTGGDSWPRLNRVSRLDSNGGFEPVVDDGWFGHQNNGLVASFPCPQVNLGEVEVTVVTLATGRTDVITLATSSRPSAVFAHTDWLAWTNVDGLYLVSRSDATLDFAIDLRFAPTGTTDASGNPRGDTHGFDGSGNLYLVELDVGDWLFRIRPADSRIERWGLDILDRIFVWEGGAVVQRAYENRYDVLRTESSAPVPLFVPSSGETIGFWTRTAEGQLLFTSQRDDGLFAHRIDLESGDHDRIELPGASRREVVFVSPSSAWFRRRTGPVGVDSEPTLVRVPFDGRGEQEIGLLCLGANFPDTCRPDGGKLPSWSFFLEEIDGSLIGVARGDSGLVPEVPSTLFRVAIPE